jgi:hypothetical protein
MSYGSSLVFSGPTPDLPLSRDSISGILYPTTKLIDATEGSIAPIGVAANPLKVRAWQRGTQAFDTGLLEVPLIDTAVTGVSVWADLVWIHNTTSNVRRLTIQETGGAKLLNDVQLLPEQVLALPRGKAVMVGIRWQADGAGVMAQIVGEQ